jgi:hypothetical protein
MPRTAATFLSSDNGAKTGAHSPENSLCDSQKLRFAIFGSHSTELSDARCDAPACSDGVLGACFLSDAFRLRAARNTGVAWLWRLIPV